MQLQIQECDKIQKQKILSMLYKLICLLKLESKICMYVVRTICMGARYWKYLSLYLIIYV